MNEETIQSIEEILGTAIEREKDSYDFYFSASLHTNDPELKAFLVGLAEMERAHQDSLKARLEEIEARRWVERAISC